MLISICNCMVWRITINPRDDDIASLHFPSFPSFLIHSEEKRTQKRSSGRKRRTSPSCAGIAQGKKGLVHLFLSPLSSSAARMSELRCCSSVAVVLAARYCPQREPQYRDFDISARYSHSAIPFIFLCRFLPTLDPRALSRASSHSGLENHMSTQQPLD